ncbi:putative general secretion pathway export protein G [Halobacteriovorax marinus SJ]|uniref:General secretion pathway export protein G n=1 Tax=Halobacteriovorax marinus (strain ATCC BAA-682 / DSM 15412 / SJ) TaxID=862908 RepID=E1WZ44_HALMS|nr:type II secretion system major pseudopilin GspG [Halobacteriovorax marinus]CBW26141.1 putative general secretion pathway export protein G [Halobacteriovorax marinus SJ]
MKRKSMMKLLRQSAGFSLIEILIALTLLGIAGTFVAGQIFSQLTEGQIKAANIQMKSFKSILQDYRRKCGTYPLTDQGLDALLNKPSGGKECRNYPPEGFMDADEIPRDPWDEEYFYESDGRDFNIWSYGPDRLEGGEGTDADIYLNKKK